VSARFAGPPGTGKTLAAPIRVARSVWRLERVGLFVVISKYLGETERNR
jgi:SpoVK/Ycf46/Vps4 family AAA+-type ATPase